MKINSIDIKNFRCFLEPIKFEFGSGLNIVNAQNGSGKSELLNAIYWTIYGKVFKKPVWVDARNEKLYPKWYTDESHEEEYSVNSVITEVEISIDAKDVYSNSDELTKWWFKKIRFHDRNSVNKNIDNVREEIEIKYIDINTGETCPVGTANIPFVLETLFPKSIRDFMWFQGEGLVNQIDLNKKNSGFDDILKTVSYFPTYTTMRKSAENALVKKQNDLNAARRNFENISKDKSDKLSKQSKLQKEIPDIKQKLEEANDELVVNQEKLANIVVQLDNVSEHAEISGKIELIKAEIKALNEVMESSEEAQVSELIRRWVIVGSEKYFEKSQDKLELFSAELKELEGTEVPRHIPGPDMIKNMLDKMNCDICDREIESEDSDAYKALEERLEQFEKDLRHKWLKNNFDLIRHKKSMVLREYKDVDKEIKTLNNRIAVKRRERSNKLAEKDALQEELNEISSSGSSGSNYKLLREQEKKQEKIIQNIELVKSNRLKSLKAKEERLKELNEEIDQFEFEDESIHSKSKEIAYYEELTNLLSDLEIEAKEDLLNQITKRSNELFKSYYHNPQVKITIPEGEIILVNPDTGEVDDDENESQNTAVRFAVITALLQISSDKLNNHFPLVADAPTSSFGWENTFHFTKSIGSNFDQVIILSKDYIREIETNPRTKTELVSVCKETGGSWYWIEQIGPNGEPVGPKNTLPKSKCKTVIKEEITK